MRVIISLFFLFAIVHSTAADSVSFHSIALSGKTANSFQAFSFPQQINAYTTVFTAFSSSQPYQSLVCAVPDWSQPGKYTLNTLLAIDRNSAENADLELTGATLADTDGEGMVLVIGDKEDHPGTGVYAVNAFDFVWKDRRQIWTVVDNETVIPDYLDGKQTFYDFMYATVDGPFAVFWGEPADGTWAGLYLTTVFGDGDFGVQAIVDYNSVIPLTSGGTSTDKFDYLSGPKIRNGILAFFGSHKANISESDVGAYSMPQPGIFVHYLFSKKLIAVADDLSLVPESLIEGEKFFAFSDVGFDGETVAFIGQGMEGTLGIYAYHLNRRTLERVVDTNCEVPGEKGVTFAAFNQPPSVYGNYIAVLGMDQYANTGIYIYPKYASENKNCSAGRLVVSTTSEFLNITTQYLGLGISGFNNDQVSFYGVTQDYTLGIYLATLNA